MPKPTSKRVHHAAEFFASLFLAMTLMMPMITQAEMQQVIVTPGTRPTRNVQNMPLPPAIELEPLQPMAPTDLSNSFLTDIKSSEDTSATTPSTAAGGEETELQCEASFKTASTACNTPGTSGMDAGQAMMYTVLANQLVSAATTIASMGKNMSKQCAIQADVQKWMAAINGVKGATCAKVVNSCTSTCEREYEQYQSAADQLSANPATAEAAAIYRKNARTAKGYLGKCEGFSAQVVAMAANATQNLGNFAMNSQCASDLSALQTTSPTYSPIAMPTIGDCTDPNNQSLTCYCAKTANASSAMCAGFNGGTNVGGTTTTTPNGSSVTSPYASTTETSGDTSDPFSMAGASKNGGGGGDTMGSGGSGAPGGGGISALGSEGGGYGAGGDPKSAITGTSGGTGSGLGGSGGGGGGGGLARNNGTAKGDGFLDKFNLKKFLPGSKYKTRGIAGMSVKSVDGITGPMGPSIWEKATRQYQEQIQKQNVILEK